MKIKFKIQSKKGRALYRSGMLMSQGFSFLLSSDNIESVTNSDFSTKDHLCSIVITELSEEQLNQIKLITTPFDNTTPKKEDIPILQTSTLAVRELIEEKCIDNQFKLTIYIEQIVYINEFPAPYGNFEFLLDFEGKEKCNYPQGMVESYVNWRTQICHLFPELKEQFELEEKIGLQKSRLAREEDGIEMRSRISEAKAYYNSDYGQSQESTDPSYEEKKNYLNLGLFNFKPEDNIRIENAKNKTAEEIKHLKLMRRI